MQPIRTLASKSKVHLISSLGLRVRLANLMQSLDARVDDLERDPRHPAAHEDRRAPATPFVLTDPAMAVSMRQDIIRRLPAFDRDSLWNIDWSAAVVILVRGPSLLHP